MYTPPPSHIDDGRSFRYRQPSTDPPPPASVASTSTSTYISNSSYVDPGPALPPPSSTHRSRREDAPWNSEIARAVGGDMARSLARLRNVAGLHTRRSKSIKAEEGDGGNLEQLEQLEREKRDSKKGVVSVSVPCPWGVFVIKDEEGRVVVVDADGEYEGGGSDDAGQVREGWGSRAARRRGDGGESWSNEGFDEELGMRLSRHDEWEERPEGGTNRSCSSRRRHRANTRSLSTNSESSTDKDFRPSPPASPTRFLMTGALDGWPSRTPSPSPASPIVPHPYTWEDTIASPSPSRPSLRLKTALQLFSRNNSLPGSWPSRTPSSRDTTTTSTTSSSVTYPKSRSPVSFHKTTTSHHTPDVVEVSYDTTPPGELSHSHSHRPRSRSRSNSIRPSASQHTQHSHRSQRASSRHTATTSPNNLLKNGSGWDDAPHEAGLKTLSHNSDAGWSSSSSFSVDVTGKESEGEAGSEARRAAARHSVSIQNCDDGGSVIHGKAYSEWDGLERLKTISEVSVAGGSIRTQHGWPTSVRSRSRSRSRSQSGKNLHKSSSANHSNSIHGHARSDSDTTYPSTSRSHHKRSTTHSPTGWSSFSVPQRPAARSADGWSTIATHNVKEDQW